MAFVSAGESASATAGAAAGEIGLDMNPRRQYAITAKGNALWFRVTTAGGPAAAVGGAGSHYIQPGMPPFPVACIGPELMPDRSKNAAFRNRISVIRDGASDGTAILSEIPTTSPS